MVVSKDQFQKLGHPADVPPEFGTQPIPEGMVRFNHYTYGEGAGASIRAHGLLRSKGEESYARGGTESPQVFATAGHPRDLLHTNTIVEGWANPRPLGRTESLEDRPGLMDIGSNYGGWDPKEHVERLEGNRSTITFHGDVPANQIIAVHEPWHGHYRHMMEVNPNRPDSALEKGIMHGEYDYVNEMPDYKPALEAAKTALAAKVMLGGKLHGQTNREFEAAAKKRREAAQS